MDQNFCTICSRNAYRMTGRKYGTDLAVCRSVNMSVLRDHSNALTEDFLSEGSDPTSLMLTHFPFIGAVSSIPLSF